MNMNSIEVAPGIVGMDHAEPIHGEIMVVSWCLGNTCNYSCPYCPKGLHDGSLPWVPLETIRSFTSKLVHHYRERLGRRVYLEFTGGEPTLYRDFIAVLEHLRSIGTQCGLISNGSLPLRYWERCAPLLDHLCLSFHPLSADPEKFLKVVEYMHKRVSTHVSVMMHPDYFDACLDLADKAAAFMENASLSLEPVLESLLPGMPLRPYSQDQVETLARKSYRIPWTKTPFTYRGKMRMRLSDGSAETCDPSSIVIRGVNRWKGWKCWAGVDELAIYADGNVHRGWCKQDLVGRVDDPEITFPLEPTVCRRESCHCNLDIMNRREEQAN